MPSINEVLERVNRARADAIDDATKAAWLIELDGKLYEEVILKHERPLIPIVPMGEPIPYPPIPPKKYPEDGDKPLLVQSPYDNLYDLYVMAQADLLNREGANYNMSATVFNVAQDEWKKQYHRTHLPIGGGGYKNVF